jgi:hypothetical protein
VLDGGPRRLRPRRAPAVRPGDDRTSGRRTARRRRAGRVRTERAAAAPLEASCLRLSRPGRFTSPATRGARRRSRACARPIGSTRGRRGRAPGHPGDRRRAAAHALRPAPKRLRRRPTGPRGTFFLTNGADPGNNGAVPGPRAAGRPVGASATRTPRSSTASSLGRPADASSRRSRRGAGPCAHCVRPEALEEALAQGGGRGPGAARGVRRVSPTTTGWRRREGPGRRRPAQRVALVVDQAGGRTFGFHEALPRARCAQGGAPMLASTHKMARLA